VAAHCEAIKYLKMAWAFFHLFHLRDNGVSPGVLILSVCYAHSCNKVKLLSVFTHYLGIRVLTAFSVINRANVLICSLRVFFFLFDCGTQLGKHTLFITSVCLLKVAGHCVRFFCVNDLSSWLVVYLLIVGK